MTGDPWAPVHVAEKQSLTLAKRDWTYKLLDELFYSGKWVLPQLARTAPDEETVDMILVAEAFARGDSRTDGFKSRLIPVPKAVKERMFGREAEALSKALIGTISEMDRALCDGLKLISVNGNSENWERLSKSQKIRNYGFIQPARASLSAIADALFFPVLWDKIAAGTEDGRNAVHASFARALAKAARTEFRRATSGIPCAQIMRPKAETRGRDAFERGIARIFRDMGLREDEHA